MRNPKLYHAMKQIFGETPKIINEGEPCHLVNVYAEYSFTPRTQDLFAGCTKGGEQYAVCCPFCGDTRQRLYISHMWDTEFVQNNVRYHCSDRLIRCFNEECMTNPEHRTKIINSLREAIGNMVEIPEDDMDTSDVYHGNELANQCLYPADAKDLDDPYTPKGVLTYICERGFDPETLQKEWGVQWLVRYGKFSHPILVIPVLQNNEYWFWQGRLVPINGHAAGEVERDPATGKMFPKYYFPHGVKKAWALYNLDKARTHDTIFIVEGVTDAWAIGESAVARFGKSLSSAQVQLLTEQCFGKHVIIVPDMDDPQALDCAKEDAMKLEIQAAFASVKLALPPDNMDPGDMLKQYGKEVAACLQKAAKSLSQVNSLSGTFGDLVTM
jgi:hypothetical protein